MKLRDQYPLYLANEALQPNTNLAVTDKFTGEVATRVALADAAMIDEAIGAAVKAAQPMGAPSAPRTSTVSPGPGEPFTWSMAPLKIHG